MIGLTGRARLSWVPTAAFAAMGCEKKNDLGIIFPVR